MNPVVQLIVRYPLRNVMTSQPYFIYSSVTVTDNALDV